LIWILESNSEKVMKEEGKRKAEAKHEGNGEAKISAFLPRRSVD
jgi:hypothetical protein